MVDPYTRLIAGGVISAGKFVVGENVLSNIQIRQWIIFLQNELCDWIQPVRRNHVAGKRIANNV